MPESSHALKKPLLGDSAYNKLKQSTTVVLPAIGALYFALAQIWHLPKAEEVVGTVAAVNTFLGLVLGISTRSYNRSDVKYAGIIEVEETPDVKNLNIILNEAAPALEKQGEVTFRVDNSSTGETPVVRP
ncbi:holin [Streptomyces phage Scap1]|uniref:Holin n=1 Tax=Streptomyces phage Scap1 TaxID=2041354 RepID=A0A2D1GNW2_9CAUD|nr:holin [Streptomyces phage Scap1]ATN93674.1 holin [Streptomyces phage Scap1]